MRVLIAFDKFKDALTAEAAGAATARVLASRHPDWELDLCPLTDGGEGFCETLTRSARGTIRRVPVTGPRGEKMPAPFGLVPFAQIPPAARTLLALPPAFRTNAGARSEAGGGPVVAVLEMAAASGLALLPPEARDPWQASSVGTGELMRAAAGEGAIALLLGVGGSATNDLGLGALAALGFQFITASGEQIAPPIPARWDLIARIKGTSDPVLPPVRIACDVANPLLGPRGAAAVYGPQKGLRPADLARMEHASARLGLLLLQHCGCPDTLMDLPGAGAAGGIAFGLLAGIGAQLLPGSTLVSAWLGLEERLAAADLVITGEGRCDESSFSGKGPGALVARAVALRKPVHLFAGAIGLGPDGHSPGPAQALRLHAISPAGMSLPEALPRAAEFLAAAVERTF